MAIERILLQGQVNKIQMSLRTTGVYTSLNVTISRMSIKKNWKNVFNTVSQMS